MSLEADSLLRHNLNMMRLSLNKVPTSLLLAALASTARAAHPLITDDTGTQGRGGRQLELVGEFGRDPDGRHGESAAVFSYGVAETLDAVVGLPVQFVRPSAPEEARTLAGVADTALELKWRFIQRGGVSLALKPGLTVTTGDDERGFGAGRSNYRLAALASASRGKAEAHANVGYVRNDNVFDERVDLWHASLAAAYSLPLFKLALNASLDSDPDPARRGLPATAVLGAIVPLGGVVDVDLGWRTGLGPDRTEQAFLAGLTTRF